MNILRKRKIINVFGFYMICILFLFLSNCYSAKEKVLIKSIAKGVSVEQENYFFSEDAEVYFGNERYSLRSKIEYNDEGKAIKLLVYYPEGILEYSQTQLNDDKKILSHYGYEYMCYFTFQDGQIQNSNGEVISTEMVEKNIARSKIDNKITLYLLK